MVSTRGGTNTAGKPTKAPLKGLRAIKAARASAAAGGPGIRNTYKKNYVGQGSRYVGPKGNMRVKKTKDMSKHKRKNPLFSGTGVAFRPLHACQAYKKGSKGRYVGTGKDKGKTYRARKNACSGGTFVCPYKKKNSKRICKPYCRKVPHK